MKKWLEIYNDISYRTRWISISVGICFWLILFLDIVAFIQWMFTIAEFGLSRIILANLSQLFLVVSLALMNCRLFALIKSKSNGLRLARVSWNSLLLLFPVANVYLYLDSAGYFEPAFKCIPIGTTICFSVSGSSAPDWLFAMYFYLSIGIPGCKVASSQ